MTVLNLVRRRRDGGSGAGHLDDVGKRHAAGRLLGSPHVATNAEAHEKSNAEILFFLRFWYDLGCPGAPRVSFEDSAKQDTKRSAVAVHSGRLFWSILGPKSDFCAFCL